MDWTNIISIALNALLGGGLIVTLATLRATKHKADAEVDARQIQNAAALLQEYKTNIIEPLKNEVNGLRKEVRNLKNAISRANSCHYADSCPVLNRMQDDKDCADTAGV